MPTYAGGFQPANDPLGLGGYNVGSSPWQSQDTGGILNQIGAGIQAPGQAIQSAGLLEPLALGIGGIGALGAGAGALGLLPGAGAGAGGGIGALPSEAAASNLSPIGLSPLDFPTQSGAVLSSPGDVAGPLADSTLGPGGITPLESTTAFTPNPTVAGGGFPGATPDLGAVGSTVSGGGGAGDIVNLGGVAGGGGVAPGPGPGPLGGVTDFLKNNPLLAAAGLGVGGMLLSPKVSPLVNGQLPQQPQMQNVVQQAQNQIPMNQAVAQQDIGIAGQQQNLAPKNLGIADTATGIAGQQNTYGNQLEQSLITGQLPPGFDAQIQQATNDAMTSIRSRYASLGMSGSSAEADALAYVQQQAAGQRAAIAQQLAQQGQTAVNSGISALGQGSSAINSASGNLGAATQALNGAINAGNQTLADLGLQQSVYQNLMQAQIQQDTALQTAIGNFAGQLGKASILASSSPTTKAVAALT